MPEVPSISKDEIADALRWSGYLIERRIEGVLRGQGYHVSANTTYPDPITRKPRELDLSATSRSAPAQGTKTGFSPCA
jgi:hypothetical protein